MIYRVTKSENAPEGRLHVSVYGAAVAFGDEATEDLVVSYVTCDQKAGDALRALDVLDVEMSEGDCEDDAPAEPEPTEPEPTEPDQIVRDANQMPSPEHVETDDQGEWQ